MERPDINSKKYIYYHKKLGKKMFNNQKYLEDCKKFSEQNVVLPQGDVSGQFYCDCKDPDVTQYPHSNTPFCFDCKRNIKQ